MIESDPWRNEATIDGERVRQHLRSLLVASLSKNNVAVMRVVVLPRGALPGEDVCHAVVSRCMARSISARGSRAAPWPAFSCASVRPSTPPSSSQLIDVSRSPFARHCCGRSSGMKASRSISPVSSTHAAFRSPRRRKAGKLASPKGPLAAGALGSIVAEDPPARPSHRRPAHRRRSARKRDAIRTPRDRAQW